MTDVDAITAEHVDEVLATTRAVRRRLDLDRPVDNHLLLDCIDLAEQAPTGGNPGSRRWIIVRDKASRINSASRTARPRSPSWRPRPSALAGTCHRNERVVASAAYLAEHVADVAAIVIPTIIGRHDGSSRPGLFDSVISPLMACSLSPRP
jgi:nitroreductase